MSSLAPAQIRRALRVIGKTLSFRDVNVSDADFIISLRTDYNKSRFLSPVSNDIKVQQEWLKNYSQQGNQAYFIIEHNSAPIGTVRLYDAKGSSFCWGSWVLGNIRPSHAAIESALMVYTYAVDHLGFTAAHLEVRRGNERVWQFHERFGARRIAETDLDYFYVLDLQSIQSSRLKYRRFLDKKLEVEFL